MRVRGYGLVVAMGAALALPAAAPAVAGALSDLVGVGSQNVYIEPPADPPAAGGKSTNAAKPGKKLAREKTGRLSKDCKKAGLKTRADCDAMHAAQAKERSQTSSPTSDTGSNGAATNSGTAEGVPTETTSGQTTATPGGTATTVEVMPTATGTQSSTTPSAVLAPAGSTSPSNCGSGGSTLGVLTNIHPC